MSDILMTNIFFMITAISSVVITIVLVITLIYIIALVKRLRSISEIVHDETLKVAHDVEEVRTSIRHEINQAKTLVSISFVKNLIKKIFTRN